MAQGDRVFVIGVATGTNKTTGKPFRDEWVFDITLRDGKVVRIQEYVDTEALANASSSADAGQGSAPPADRSDLRAS